VVVVETLVRVGVAASMWSSVAGELVPIPTLPAEVILMRSLAVVEKVKKPFVAPLPRLKSIFALLEPDLDISREYMGLLTVAASPEETRRLKESPAPVKSVSVEEVEPLTLSLDAGELVPIPTLPAEVIRIRSPSVPPLDVVKVKNELPPEVAPTARRASLVEVL
jgi:hypothetical protein